MLGAALVILSAVLTWTDLLWDWDQVVYDRYLSAAFVSPPPDVVIVAIDEYSLAVVDASLGAGWPWPRAIHAELITRLSQADARAILVDILFTEPDRRNPDNDAMLAAALAAAGNVVLPIHLAGHASEGGERQAFVFPIPQLATTAAAIGHTHSRFDRDGILRSVSLGIASGEQRIPHASASLLALEQRDLFDRLPGERAPDGASGAWYEDFKSRFLFAGPPGHIRRIPYAEALQWDAAQLKEAVAGKLVLVGATAPGMDLLPTPVSGDTPMPGVEVNANVLQALRESRTVTTTGAPVRFAFTLLAVLPIYGLFALIRSRWVFPLTLAGFAAIAAVSVALLAQKIWVPPMSAVVTLSAAYLLWSFRRLGNAVRFLTRELRQLEEETRRLAPPAQFTFDELISHAANLIDIRDAEFVRPDGTRLHHWQREAALSDGGDEALSTWYHTVSERGPELRIAVAADELSAEQEAVLLAVAQRLAPQSSERAATAVERIEQRMQQIQVASQGLSDLRRFVAESVAQMASGMVVVDGLGQVREANTNAARFTGIAPSQLVGGSALDVLNALLLQNQSPARLLRAVQLLGENTFAYATGADESDLIIELAPYGRDYGPPFGVIINMSDISELRASERRRSEMLSFISHDLRSPLVSTLALTQIATLKPERLSDGKTVKRIEDNVKKTLELADDFLHLARAESGSTLQSATLDLAAIAAAAFEQVRAQADQKQIRMELVTPESLTLEGEAGLLERAAVNLLTNAIKYSGESASVTLRVDTEDDAATLAVTDTGLGIPADALPTLFDRFTRVQNETHRRRGGAGLGLAFVHTVATRHGGTVEVQSVEGEGSTFTLRIPRTRATTGDGSPAT